MAESTTNGGAASEEDLSKLTVKFQCGLLRETETFFGEDVDLICTEALIEYVTDMLTTKYPDHPYGDMQSKLLLYQHNPDQSLSLLTTNATIYDGIIIDIILSADAKQEHDDTICPHILTVHTYKAPTFCDHCGVVMFGLLKQGLKCEGCNKNFHKGCAYNIPNNCTRDISCVPAPLPSTPKRKGSWSGRALWIDKALQNRPQVPHTFFVHSFRKPTACRYCKKMIKGVYRNGMKCKDCKYICHKKCAKDVGTNCPGEVPSLSRIDSGEWTLSRSVISNEHIAPGEDYNEHNTEMREEEGVANEESPTSSMSSQEHLETTGDPPTGDPPTPPMDTIAEEKEDSTSNDGSDHNPAEQIPSANIQLQRVTGVSLRHTKPPPAAVLMEGWMVHYTDKSHLRKKHYWRLDTKCLTLYKAEDTPHYYKEIQLTDILAVDPVTNPSLYPLSPAHVFEIVISECTYYVGVDMTNVQPSDLTPPPNDDISGVNVLGDCRHLTLSQLEDIGVGKNKALQWEDALHCALMPVTPQASMGSLTDMAVQGGLSGRPSSFRGRKGSLQGSFRGSFHGRGNSFRGGSIRGHRGSTRGSFRAVKQSNPPIPPRGVPMTPPKPRIETKMDVSQFYQIYPQEILGSGQFGTVFGGQNRTTGRKVAVKVIDKLRFPHKQDAALRQEVTILQCLNHNGIICLEQMFETPEKIYIVMEKMNGDMLEMILNSPISRLTERVTRFLVYQILTALQYLHRKDIVHCDLKPENVLLTSETGMPQAKLCDFGFARIIGDKSFRKSIVGTPAYLAPEVLKNEGYNRSLDLWSVGVIIYVSLSGTFPFNEDEEISDQIQNAAFMYPPDPWGSISHEAIDLVNKLLQVSRRTRFKTNQALNHIWLRDLALWEDLCQLEGRLGMRYLTHESEDAWWKKQGAKPHPLTTTQRYQHHVYNNVVILDEPRPGAPAIATTAAIAKSKTTTGKPMTNGTTPNKPTNETAPPEPSIPPPPSDKSNRHSKVLSDDSRKSYISLSNEEVETIEKHAERAGFTISTV